MIFDFADAMKQMIVFVYKLGSSGRRRCDGVCDVYESKLSSCVIAEN